MKIAAVIVTHNRLELLPRALKSVKEQSRKPDFIYIVSNSTADNFEKEQKLCANFGFQTLRNSRTQNYAGALNTAVEEIIKENGISEDLYFASLDDDDEWLPNYLQEIENNNSDNYELLVGSLLRSSNTENNLLVLPNELSEKDFLIGNPGISGSNTFIKLTTLLKAGAFDEGLSATIDRDFFVRVFLQKPKYKIVNKHLVTQHTDNDRERVTTSGDRKKRSLQMFYYKYHSLMSNSEKADFLERAERLFSISKENFEETFSNDVPILKREIEFSGKGKYQFIIGFIAGDTAITERIITQIIEKKISVNLLVIIDNTPKTQNLSKCKDILQTHNIAHKIVEHNEWKSNLAKGHYGSTFKSFAEINSIPLGRTILHHHLFTETNDFQKPVYWIIDDDISFSTTVTNGSQSANLFEIINHHLENTDGIIGGISNDPPVPALSCIRGQLIDFFHSYQANNVFTSDYLNVRTKPDYYYDLSDIHSDHLEIPIYHTKANEENLSQIFSGKSISRQALQNELKAIEKTVSKRGANTLVFNRDLLHYYPVINLEVNNKFARRGNLTWALLNQVVSNKKIIEHTFCINHNRPKSNFSLDRELDKSAYDIIGYGF
ncbi:MAG: glycosyltransferase [Bacteroidia bacterium]|nr:glycosyltransferase [Bacteroidia bacterium]